MHILALYDQRWNSSARSRPTPLGSLPQPRQTWRASEAEGTRGPCVHQKQDQIGSSKKFDRRRCIL
jgi:hypothetical protein